MKKLAVILMLLALLTGAVLVLHRAECLSAEEAVASVEEKDGTVTVTFSEKTQAFQEWIVEAEEEEKSLSLLGYRRPLWPFMKKEGTLSTETTNDMLIFYESHDGNVPDRLLYGRIDGGRLSFPWIGIRFFGVIGLAAAVFGGVLLLATRGRKGWFFLTGGLCWPLGIFLGCGKELMVVLSADKPFVFFGSALFAAFAAFAALCWKKSRA